jgi:1-acyl-sn-glycerol-3-phosphate acyltransferase
MPDDIASPQTEPIPAPAAPVSAANEPYEEGRVSCMALTRAGQPCKNGPLPGSPYCRIHQTLAEEANAELPVEPQEQTSIVETIADEASNARTAAPDEGMRQQLAGELDTLIQRVRAKTPGYAPPPFSPRRLLELIKENLDKLSPEIGLSMLEQLRRTITNDVLNLETWKGIWYLLNYSLQYQAGVLKRRMTGEYEVDPWGLDLEFLDTIKPFFEFLYKIYWRVQTSGLENVPNAGRALLVGNHSGQLPWDGTMVGTALLTEHPAQRLVRSLYGTWFPTLPFFSEIFTKCGQVLGTVENGIRLLEQDELVAVYPEGYKGVGKLFSERYKLARFGRGGFVKMALKTGAPIIPFAVVGAEETYISLGKSQTLARLTGFPYFPISPAFPWFGLLGFVPLPTQWYIDFGEPIATDGYGPLAAENPVFVSQLTDQVRNVVQDMVYERLRKRRSVFFG